MSNRSIWSIDRILSGSTTLGQSGPGSNGNEGVLHIPLSSSITGASGSDCLMSYQGHSLQRSYTSAEMQAVYSTAPANRAGGGQRVKWLKYCEHNNQDQYNNTNWANNVNKN